jgi:hypothetical protein
MKPIRHILQPFLFLFLLTAANATGTGQNSDTIGVQRTAVILLNTAGGMPADLPSAPEINEAVFTGPYSANAFYKEVSFHQLELQGDIWGWYDRPDLR